MSSPKCCAKVFFHGMVSGVMLDCSRVAKRDGYCTQHHPEAVAERIAERKARWRRKERRRDSAARRRHLQDLA